MTAGLPKLEVFFRKPLHDEERKIMNIWKHGGKLMMFSPEGGSSLPRWQGGARKAEAGLPRGRSSEVSLSAHPSLGCEQEGGRGRVARSRSRDAPSAPKAAPGCNACSHCSVLEGTLLPFCNNFFFLIQAWCYFNSNDSRIIYIYVSIFVNFLEASLSSTVCCLQGKM